VGESFTVERLLASGGMSQVYQASQESIRRDVALKVATIPEGGELAVADALQNEAFLAGRVHHPHVVSVFDHGRFEGGHFYLAMELLEGETVSRTLARAGPLGWVRAVRIMIQVCEALGVVHEKGLVHRDLKPGNLFLVRTEGQGDFVKLLDFGLSTGISRLPAFLGLSQPRAGTPLYMSPEQIRGKYVDERSDLYALGAITYELITGEPVFTGPDPFEDHLKSVPVPISISRPQIRVPRSLDDLLLRLMAKDPAQRPASCGEVLDRFSRALPMGTSGAALAEKQTEYNQEDSWFDTFPRGIQLREPGFVGRTKELTFLGDALARAEQGQGSVLWLTGERGSGKTSLGNRFLQEASDKGFATAASPAGSQGPIMGAWRAAIGEMVGVEVRSREDVRKRIASMAAAGHDDSLVEGISDLLYPGAAIREMMRAGRDVFADYIQASVERFLRRVAHKGRIALHMDDFHEVDKFSASFLDRFCKGLGPRPIPIVILVTSTPLSTEPDEDDRRELIKARDAARNCGCLKKMSRMPEREIVDLVEAMSQSPCTGPVRRMMRRTAGGNPMFAVQMFRHLAAQGAVAVVNGKVRVVPGADTSVPDALMDLLVARIDEMTAKSPDGAAAAQMMARISMLGRWATMANLWSLADMEGRNDLRDSVDPLVDRLVSDGFVNRVAWANDEALVFAHALMGEAVQKRPGDTSLTRLHLFTAQTLEKAYGEDIGRVASEVGRHYLETGYLDRATDYLLTGGDVALEEGRFKEAGDLYTDGEACLTRMRLENDKRMKRVHLVLAELLWQEGRYRDAHERLEAVGRPGRKERDSPEALRAVELSAKVAESMRRSDEALSILKRLAEACETRGDRHRAANAMIQMAAIRMDQGDNGKAAKLAERAEDLVVQDGDTRTLGLNHLVRGRLMRKLGSAESCFRHLDSALDILSGPRDFVERAEAMFFKGAKLLELERYAEAEDVFRTGVGMCERSGFARGLSGHLINLGSTLAAMGRVEESGEALMRAQSIAEKMGDRRRVAQCLTSMANQALRNEEWSRAFDLSGRTLALYRDLEYVFGERVSLLNLGMACQGKGDMQGAESHLRECLATTERDKGMNRAVAEAYEVLADILEARGDGEGAVRHRLDALMAYDHLELSDEADEVRARIGDCASDSTGETAQA